jgi:hypothetical protein
LTKGQVVGIIIARTGKKGEARKPQDNRVKISRRKDPRRLVCAYEEGGTAKWAELPSLEQIRMAKRTPFTMAGVNSLFIVDGS